jgi:ferredoxin
MNIKILFISPNGTTKTTTSLLKESFLKHNHQVDCINIAESPYRENQQLVLDEISSADIVGFGSAAYHMDLMQPMIDLFSLLQSRQNQHHFRAFFFMNYSGITTGKAFLLYARKFHTMGIPVCGALKVTAPHFHHVEEFPTQNTYSTIDAFAAALQKKHYADMTDQEIEKKLQPFTRKVHLIYPLIHLIGKKRELPIIIDQQACKRCGKCMRECPAGAIEQNGSITINFAKCLHCYHCTVACPQNAIHCPVENLDAMMQTNIKLIGKEQPANQYYV